MSHGLTPRQDDLRRWMQRNATEPMSAARVADGCLAYLGRPAMAARALMALEAAGEVRYDVQRKGWHRMPDAEPER